MKKWPLLLLCLPLLVSCKKKEDDEDTEALLGTWAMTCVEVDSLYITASFTYNDSGTGSSSSGIFTDKNCNEKYFLVTTDLTWKKGEAVKTVEGAHNLDTETTKVELTPQNEDLLKSLNDGSVCEGGWAKDKPKELVNLKNCTEFANKGDKDFDIFKIDGTKLYVGKTDAEHLGGTEATRPFELDTQRIYEHVN